MIAPWIVLAALAQDVVEPIAEPPTADETVAATAEADRDDEAGYIEVLVIGEHVISEARDRVVREMESLGWKAKRKRNGLLVFRGPRVWMGRAVLHDSGDLTWSIPAIGLPGPSDGGAAYDPDQSLGERYAGGTVGVRLTAPAGERRKIVAIQTEVHEAVQPLVLDYRRKIQQRYFSSYVAELPERLDALWESGTPLDAGRPLETHDERRAEVLGFWASRTGTPEGRTVSRTVEIWLRQVVMASDHPVTAEEASRAEDRREDGRPLDIF